MDHLFLNNNDWDDRKAQVLQHVAESVQSLKSEDVFPWYTK
jgi:hypothetical protein